MTRNKMKQLANEKITPRETRMTTVRTYRPSVRLARHREKWRPALDLIDEAIGWGLAPKVIVADGGYGQITAFRHGLAERGLDFIVAVRSDESAPHDAVPTTPALSGNGRKPAARYRRAASSLRELAAEPDRTGYRRVTWRRGSKGPMRSRFRVRDVRPAGVTVRRYAMARVGGAAGWDGVPPALQDLIRAWTGACPTCHRDIPAAARPEHHPPKST